MGERTAIGWTEKTWNPWHGCRKVSPGCKHCYMYREKTAYGQDPTKVVQSKTTFTAPLKWKEPARVFTCSWSDFFIEEADDWRDEAWEIIRRTPSLTYQILTKRPERMRGRLPWTTKPWPHVWLGISAEDQRRADERVPMLLQAPAAMRWISAEPLLGPVTIMREWRGVGHRYAEQADGDGCCCGRPRAYHIGLDWVVVGGESGPDHRPMEIEWLASIVAQCRHAGVPVFVKQDSGRLPGLQGRIPDDLWIHEFPR